MTTLTYQPDQNQPEFSEEEQEAIRVGEQMQQEEQQLLAGKYRDAEQLEKAYLELQQKFSQGQENNEPQEPQQQQQQEVVEEEQPDLMDILWNEAQTDWTEDTLNQLRNSDPIDIAQAYLEYRAQNQAHELDSEETAMLYDVVGGETEFNSMLRWAAGNMDENYCKAFDQVMQKGDLSSCMFAVQALSYQMAQREGFSPNDFLSGSSAASPTADVFRSQAEVVQAMSDARYDRDPAYRQDVMNKLERSTDLMY